MHLSECKHLEFEHIGPCRVMCKKCYMIGTTSPAVSVAAVFNCQHEWHDYGEGGTLQKCYKCTTLMDPELEATPIEEYNETAKKMKKKIFDIVGEADDYDDEEDAPRCKYGKHVVAQEGEGIYQCIMCPDYFGLSYSPENQSNCPHQHLENYYVHNGQNDRVCVHCGKIFKAEAIAGKLIKECEAGAHKCIVTPEGSFICTVCQVEMIPQPTENCKHIQKEDLVTPGGKFIRPFCVDCGKVFPAEQAKVEPNEMHSNLYVPKGLIKVPKKKCGVHLSDHNWAITLEAADYIKFECLECKGMINLHLNMVDEYCEHNRAFVAKAHVDDASMSSGGIHTGHNSILCCFRCGKKNVDLSECKHEFKIESVTPLNKANDEHPIIYSGSCAKCGLYNINIKPDKTKQIVCTHHFILTDRKRLVICTKCGVVIPSGLNDQSAALKLREIALAIKDITPQWWEMIHGKITLTYFLLQLALYFQGVASKYVSFGPHGEGKGRNILL